MSQRHRIRPATDSERAECARQWVSSFSPHARMIDGADIQGVTIGSQHRALAPYLWKRAHAGLVREMLSPTAAALAGALPPRLDVLVLDTMPAEPLGWVCFEPETGAVHYVYAVDRARRKGIGSRLLEHAAQHGATRPTCTTASGLGLLDRVRPVDPNAVTQPIEVAR